MFILRIILIVGVETCLNDKLKSYKLALQNNDCLDKVKSVEGASSLSSCREVSKSPVRKLNRSNKTLLKSPTFDRHRKANMKKFRKPMSLSGILQTKSVETLSTPKRNNCLSKSKAVSGSDDDIFDSSVIDMTPNVEVSKRYRSILHSQKKKTHSSASNNKTLTQMFSGHTDTADNEKKYSFILFLQFHIEGHFLEMKQQ